MPIFEYECTGCGTRFEELVFSSSVFPACPQCNGREVKKLFSPFGFKSGSTFVSSGSQGSCSSCSSFDCSHCKPDA